MPDHRGIQPITADELEVARHRLTRVRAREGYDAAEVDDLLERLVLELRSPRPTTTAEDIEEVRLTPIRLFKPGYDMGELDGLLDRVAQSLRDLGAVRPPTVGDSSRTEPTGVPWERLTGSIPWATLVAVTSLLAAVVVAVVLLF